MTIPLPIRWLTAIVFIAVVIVLSVTPGYDQKDDSVFVWLVTNTPSVLQKFMHITVYAALTFLLVWALANVSSRVLRMAVAVILAIGLGIFLEWYQTRIPGRFGTLFDVLLNICGVLIGLTAASLVFQAKVK